MYLQAVRSAVWCGVVKCSAVWCGVPYCSLLGSVVDVVWDCRGSVGSRRNARDGSDAGPSPDLEMNGLVGGGGWMDAAWYGSA